jgi:predicted MFS family arabinose efflux permease
MVPESVDRAYLANAIALNSIAFNMSRSLGPAVAGAVIALFGPGVSYLCQAAIYGLSTVWTIQLRLPNRPPSGATGHGGRERSFAGDTVDGWRYVARHATIRTALLVSALISFFGFSVTTLLPVFAKDVLQAGPTGQGLLLASMGIGAVISGLLVASFSERIPTGPFMIAGVVAYGVSSLALAASGWLALSVGMTLMLGIFSVAATTLVQTVLQGESEPAMRGRVMGAYQQHHVLVASGGLAAGALASVIGAQLTVGGFGVACVVGSIAFLLAFPLIRTIR